MNTWHSFKGYLAGAVALIACPCHLPLTLPLLIGLTAGTAFSAWLTVNFITTGVVFTVIFLASLALAFIWNGNGGQPNTSVHQVSKGPVSVTLVTSSICQSCDQAKALWQSLGDTYKFKFDEVDINSRRGRELAANHNVFTTPTTFINGRVAFRGVPKRDHAAAAVK